MRKVILLLAVLSTAVFAKEPKDDEPIPGISKKTQGMRHMPGFFNLHWDEKKGALWMEIDKFGSEFLYVDSLPAGLGSNDVGLDRGQPGESRVVAFQRVGPKVLLVQHNEQYRATSDSAPERQSVAEAFATSIIWGGTIGAEEGSKVLVDVTSLVLSDVHHVSATLKSTGQGVFKLDDKRSAVYLPGTKSFPRNTELEATLTFAGEEPGAYVREVVPEPTAITLRERHSFIQLPGPGFNSRAADPRAGFFGPQVLDFGVPVGEQLRRHFIARHRMTPGKPLVYYVDPAAPEPIRGALLEGASWWAAAFEAAGFRFEVKLLPADADPMDVRYNVIQWVHRSTRGWSYGGGTIDPRTGEILSGHVTLGSQRVRQDYMIFESLLSPWKSSSKEEDPRMLAASLARIRQLAAHEVGHSLGLEHNFAASMHGRASVMDYPHPLVKLTPGGALDLSDAYATGIGEWDKLAIGWGYAEKPEAERTKLLTDGLARGLRFLSDEDARPAGSASPVAHLWDNGTDAAEELTRVLDVRQKALAAFGPEAIREGVPMAILSDVLVPAYLFHRYQTEAAAKSIGGQDYTYAVRGDGQVPVRAIPPEAQRRALSAVLSTLSPAVLTLPDRIVQLLPPHPQGWSRTRESFPTRTGLTFDPTSAAEAAAHQSLSLLLEPERAARLVVQTAPGLGEVIDGVLNATWRAAPRKGSEGSVQRAVDDVALEDLLGLARDVHTSPEARATALLSLRGLSAWAASQSSTEPARRAHLAWAVERIARIDLEPSLKASEPVEPPPGMPIGSFMCGDGTGLH
ncbi:MAG TPA: zinc-dependent metalloprotease [Myxococcales bacterium]|nr:zinc-dependent metalloprotease [Myxococcales bacterium]